MNYIHLIVSILSLIASLCSVICQSLQSKKEYIESRKNKIDLRQNIRLINKNSVLTIDEIASNMNTKDDCKMILYWYCCSITSKLNDFYPECKFQVSVKSIKDDYVYTILSNGQELFLNDSKQFIEDNIEYTSILKDDFEYFFVTDLCTFDNKIQKYITSDCDWQYKYNTSIVFPIKYERNNKQITIGFICINSPQTLKNKKKNSFIIELLRKTSDNIADIVTRIC